MARLAGEDLRKRALELMTASGMNKVTASTLIPGISQAAVFKYFAGELESENAEEKIRELVALLERQGGNARAEVVSIERGAQTSGRLRRALKARPVYDIASTRKISSSIDFAVEHQAIVLITADYGVGKTRAVEVWRSQNAPLPSLIFEFDGYTESAKFTFTARLAQALGMGDIVTSSVHAAATYNRIVERLREEPMVLIFDQCEAVRVEILQLIRQIWDKTRDYGVAVVLLAGPPLYERLKFRKVRALGALTSRISAWPVIHGPDRDEVAGILAAEGYFVEGSGLKGSGKAVTEAAFDLWYRGIGGSMRTLLETLDLMSRVKGQRIGQKTVQDALAMKTGTLLDASASGWTRGRGEKAADADGAAEEAV